MSVRAWTRSPRESTVPINVQKILRRALAANKTSLLKENNLLKPLRTSWMPRTMRKKIVSCFWANLKRTKIMSYKPTCKLPIGQIYLLWGRTPCSLHFRLWKMRPKNLRIRRQRIRLSRRKILLKPSLRLKGWRGLRLLPSIPTNLPSQEPNCSFSARGIKRVKIAQEYKTTILYKKLQRKDRNLSAEIILAM